MDSDFPPELLIGPIRLTRLSGGGISALDLVEALFLPEFSTKPSIEDDGLKRREKARRSLSAFRKTSQVLNGLEQRQLGYKQFVITKVEELKELIQRKESFNGEPLPPPSPPPR